MEQRHVWILVGGRSTRMGRDKALVEVGGRPLVLAAVDAGRAACPAVTLVGDPERYSHLGLAVVPDRSPGEGPLAGIEAALAATEADLNLILACDMPALDPSIFETLFAAGGDVAMPRYSDGKAEPLCAVYHRRCLPSIRAALAGGVRKVTEALEALEVRYILAASPDSFVNLNTPDELRAYTNG